MHTMLHLAEADALQQDNGYCRQPAQPSVLRLSFYHCARDCNSAINKSAAGFPSFGM